MTAPATAPARTTARQPGFESRARRLYAALDEALASFTLTDLLDDVLVRITDAVGGDVGHVLLLDEAAGELVVRAARGPGATPVASRIPVGRGFAGAIASDGAPAIAGPSSGFRSVIGVPLRVRSRLIGVLEVGTLEGHAFTEDELELLRLGGERTALAIEHARAFEAEHRLADRLLKLQAVTDAALAHLALNDLLDELLDRVRRILDADTCAILLLDESTNELVARAARGIEEEVEQGVRIPLARGFAGRIAAERRPIVVDDIDSFDIYNPLLRKRGIRSLLGAPLLTGDKVLGVIHVGTLVPRRFTPDDVDLLEHAAERAAMGLEKALVHEQLIRFDQVRNAFVAIASHELRTPSAAILGAALTLYRRAGELGPERDRELRRMLAEQAERLAVLIEQLLDLSRLEAQAVEIEPRRLSIRRELERIAAGIGPAGDARIAIRAPEELEAEIDPVAFERILANLLLNATRHGAPPITVTAERRGERLCVAVEDRGPGVGRDVRDRLFEPFARGEAATATGSGLGLAIARSYATAHGGDLLYDEPPVGGSCFRVVLPASTQRRSRASAP